MLLLNGITGIHVDALPEVDSLQFKRLCYSLANYSNGKILSFEEPHASQNFYKIELGLHNESIFILLNCLYPFLAFASSVQYFKIEFIDHSLSNIVSGFNEGFRVLSAIETNQQFELDERTHNLLTENNLNEAEINEILYWKPKTVGDVIFNFWD
ncbi:hypothetical protein BC351_34425 [Paenibacillus ferrarius]|uniref:Uncharacterized protein n=1 Tax=Paenibacillus ferrarius TaxID=1469647 RepID=A0A1V4HEH3_9BACL|nr:hypothetical protein [Paenibacillus ferrarius]OPH51910.1 hypothetical protein BC351_34425 [Paenibacillus ferrarius]